MDRRDFLSTLGAATVTAVVPRIAMAGSADYRNLLILVELKGGNDGLNTVIPYADAEYYRLRPRLAIPRDRVLQLDERTGLHPSLEPLNAVWQSGELAIVQGVGYPGANLSHFRSIEIWDTASRSDQYLQEGWLARAFARAPTPRSYAADAIVVGGSELGPFAGAGARAIALSSPDQFLREARLAAPGGQPRTPALKHILKVEQDIAQAAANLKGDKVLRTEFPQTAFGNAMRTAAQVGTDKAGVAAVKVSLNGFDTHSGQQAPHARLLKDLAEGLAALKSALVETERWNSTLVMTYAEFGRRPRENQSGGTDHGTANAHFLLGGRVRGGLHGLAPALARLDGNGNLTHGVDFRELYAAVLERWWQVDAQAALAGRFAPLDVINI